jgi:hypothetical protein
MALVLAVGFAAIYVPVIASEERFLRATFPEFEDYCRRVPRLIPHPIQRPAPAHHPTDEDLSMRTPGKTESAPGNFSLRLYLSHREYNASIGAALLYLSLLLLRPAFSAFVSWVQ